MSEDSKIYIGTKFVDGTDEHYRHLYLMYDEDGDLTTTNDEFVIRGGPDFGQV
jgi:hypothetical protein